MSQVKRKVDSSSYTVVPGHPLPLGASITPRGVRCSVFSRSATTAWLLLYDSPDDDAPAREIELDPHNNRTGDIWHVELCGAGEGLLYNWRMIGPFDPGSGHRFDPAVALMDPFAQAVAGSYRWELGQSMAGTVPAGASNNILPPKCLVAANSFDWSGDRFPQVALEDSVIYEMHVRGFTRHQSSGTKNPGTFLGIIEKIDYLKKLGVTAVELLPVHEFNENELIRRNPATGEKLKNYWGYSTVLFYAPNKAYAAGGELSGAAVLEFKTMVRALHAEGIEVFLDVVFNHTAEGNETGPTLNFRGLDNSIYYILEDDDRSRYKNFSGCGNTLNCNHPVVRAFIRNCLRYWVVEMHVDGFRFDLASILGRDRRGEMLVNPPLLESISEDPILRHVKIIAEAWDAAGAYQVGSFPGQRWSEWNGRFRDDVRRFWRGERYSRNGLASRLTGSSDIYTSSGKLPRNSINFITSHDGFPLNDLVSYERKHNEANGEDNRDGDNHNLSVNCGVEGPSSNPEIESRRRRLIRSMLATLLVSQGVPMILAGDEFRRTQRGNNNAYCQDNEISWLDWGLAEKNSHLVEFTRRLIAIRKAHPVFRRSSFFTGVDHDGDGWADIAWHDANGGPTHWHQSRPVLACRLNGSARETGAGSDSPDFYLMFNSGRQAHTFRLPPAGNNRQWKLVLDTADENHLPSVENAVQLEDQAKYRVGGHGCVVLTAG